MFSIMSGPISTSEAAERLGVSVTTVLRLARTGELPSIRKMSGLRGGYLFDPGVVDLYGRHNPPRPRGWPPGKPRKKSAA